MNTLTRCTVVLALLLAPALAAWAGGPQVRLDVAFGKPLLYGPSPERLNYLKIGMTGFPMADARERTPVNLAIVLDRSGSMQGEKLQHAKQAAIAAIDRLNREDIVAVVAYDSDVRVLVPATKVTDKRSIFRAIEELEAGSNTALFAGVSKGAQEVRKFFDHKRVNRIILLSDGLANEGPSSPEDLGDLGASLGREGISVTTFGLGLGYNEDLMTQLAQRSEGNHAFIETPRELARVFDLEFGDVLSVVAQEVQVTVTCRNLTPIRALGRSAVIRGQTIEADLNQLYANQEKFILVEVEAPAAGLPELKPLVEVTVKYRNMVTKAEDTLTATVEIGFSSDSKEVAGRENREVMVSAINLLANEQYKVATRLRDEGKVDQARQALEANKKLLLKGSIDYRSDKLEKMAVQNEMDAKNLDDASWNKTRKNMRMQQQSIDMQQAW
ncbi:MAG: VWA domain-containing protein [Candidatus Riflebacteria bacterium]|nr:VWA domain-containing protein [Candidatus Riflebacteria bacterium]